MSEFSNRPSAVRRDPLAYTRAVLDLLGDQKPLEVLGETLGFLVTAATGVEDAKVRQPEVEGKWSALQILQHLADTESIYSNRYRFAVAQDGVTIGGFDQEAWAANLWRGDEPLSEVFEQLAALRTINLRFLARLDDEQWERSVMHAERGRESVAHLAKLHAGHDLVHRNQFTRVLEAVRRSR